MGSKVERKIDLSGLPRWENGKNKGNINWEKSILNELYFEYSDKNGVIKITDYNSKTRKLTIAYKENKFKIDTRHLVRCTIGKILNLFTNEFKINIGACFKDNKRDIVIMNKEKRKRKDNKGNNKWYKYSCNKCSWTEGWISENHLLNGQGCSCCASRTVIEGINDIPTIAPEIVKYFQGGYEEAKLYTYNSSQKIYPICIDCGRIKDKAIIIKSIYNNNSIGCSCSDKLSYIFKFTFNLLEQLCTNLKTEEKYNWCKFYNSYKNKYTYGIYDFAIEDIKLIIETDGGWHRRDNNMSGQTKEESVFIDAEKDRLAIEHGYKVIRISDEGDIKQNILNSSLNELFDLNNINWNKCDEFACSNLIKVACEFKRNNPKLTTTDIGNIMGYKKGTICKWLKNGNELGWCHYNANDEKIKSSNKLGKNGKQVEVFKNGVSLGVFESTIDLERQSEKLFGVKFSNGQISAVCRDEQKTHKGFTFKYIKGGKV